MDKTEEEIGLLESLLGVTLPKTYVEALKRCQSDPKVRSRIAGLPISLDLDSAWGATEHVRACRPDLPPTMVGLRIAEQVALCLDCGGQNMDEHPVICVEQEGRREPSVLWPTLRAYLDADDASFPATLHAEGLADEEYWFQHGLARLEHHVRAAPFKYNHKSGGQIPRSHLWRPYRFCVQDVILGITVIRHDRKYNRLEVDVFLTAEIPEYEPDSGVRALALMLLSDAYKSGGSMEIRFTEHVEGGHVPAELAILAKKHGVTLVHLKEGGITPKEAKSLYLALSGFSANVREEILVMDEEGRLSAAAVCFGMHHGAWTPQDLEMILFTSHAPESILRGSLPPEAWHIFHYDLVQCRNALMGGYLDREMRRKEHPLEDNHDSVVELEDDERSVGIEFDADFCAKVYTLGESETPLDRLPWLYNETENRQLLPGQRSWSLIRARDGQELRAKANQDLDIAIDLKKRRPKDQVSILFPCDFKRIHMPDLVSRASENGIALIVCPEFTNRLDEEVLRRLESLKVMRQ